MLDKQYNLYSADTSDFYSNHERYWHNTNYRYRREQVYVKKQLTETSHKLKKLGYTDSYIKELKNITNSDNISDKNILEYIHWTGLYKHKQEKMKESKEKLISLLSNKVAQNKLSNGKDHIRVIKKESLKDNNVISAFDSCLSRIIGIKQDELTDSLIVVQVYYFDIFKDIAFYGFIYNGAKYKYFTSSAGQIRNKKAVFIKEDIWNHIEKTIMCGLTIDKINSKGGNNANKHLAYMALTSSATDEWKEFNIDKSIVIEDFETQVYGTFDFVDETDYSVTRRTDYVPVPHTDGAGMILPSVSSKNFMFRAPWIKGLLGVFDFREFIKEKEFSPVITDIYGKEHNIINEDIQIIFTRSQFKMH